MDVINYCSLYGFDEHLKNRDIAGINLANPANILEYCGSIVIGVLLSYSSTVSNPSKVRKGWFLHIITLFHKV